MSFARKPPFIDDFPTKKQQFFCRIAELSVFCSKTPQGCRTRVAAAGRGARNVVGGG